MKVLVTGGSGLLGGYIQKELKDRRIEYFAPESHVMNITDELFNARQSGDSNDNELDEKLSSLIEILDENI